MSLRIISAVLAVAAAVAPYCVAQQTDGAPGSGTWQPPAGVKVTPSKKEPGAVVVDATRRGVATVQGFGLASIAGDEDNFGYGGGWTPPLSCEVFDNRGPEDLGVFDQREPVAGQYNSICTFNGSWSQSFAVPPGGLGQFRVQLRILGGSGSTAFCFASPCACATASPALFINGVQQDNFFYDPGCATITYWEKTFQGADASIAAGGTLNFVVQWNNQPFALDWAKVLDVLPVVKIKLLDGDAQKGVVSNAAEKKLRVQLSTDDPSFSLARAAVTFKVASTPPKAIGTAVGVNDKATATTVFGNGRCKRHRNRLPRLR